MGLPLRGRFVSLALPGVCDPRLLMGNRSAVRKNGEPPVQRLAPPDRVYPAAFPRSSDSWPGTLQTAPDERLHRPGRRERHCIARAGGGCGSACALGKLASPQPFPRIRAEGSPGVVRHRQRPADFATREKHQALPMSSRPLHNLRVRPPCRNRAAAPTAPRDTGASGCGQRALCRRRRATPCSRLQVGFRRAL